MASEQWMINGTLLLLSSYLLSFKSPDRPLLPDLYDHQVLVLHGLAEVGELFRSKWIDGCIPRVADTLYNPFGEDDDDFELNELINRLIFTFINCFAPTISILLDISESGWASSTALNLLLHCVGMSSGTRFVIRLDLSFFKQVFNKTRWSGV